MISGLMKWLSMFTKVQIFIELEKNRWISFAYKSIEIHKEREREIVIEWKSERIEKENLWPDDCGWVYNN